MEITQTHELPPERPHDFIMLSILSTLLLCPPTGVVAIFYAVKVDRLYDSGSYDASIEASKKAGQWTKLTIKLGLVFWAIFAAVKYLGLDTALMDAI